MKAERLLSVWWARILITMGVLICGAIALRVAPVPAAMAPILLYGILALSMIVVEARRGGSAWYACGLYVGSTTLREIAWGLAIALASAGIVAAIAIALGGTFVVVDSPLLRVVGAMFSITVFAIGEEVLFRGTIFQALEDRFGGVVAILATSLPFALAHIMNPGSSVLSTVNVFFAGVLMGSMLMASSSLWPSISFHVVWNIVVALCFGAVSGNDMGAGLLQLDDSGITGVARQFVNGPFGIEEGLVTTILLIAATVLVHLRLPSSAYVVAIRFHRSHHEALSRTAS